MPAGKIAAWRRLGRRIDGEGSEFSITTRHGHRFSGHTRDLIGRTIYYTGHWEPNFSGYLERTLRTGDGFIDVGANHGWFTLLASKLVGPEGFVVAVEANAEVFRTLTHHVESNELENVRLINAAASRSEGALVSIPGPDDNQGMSRVAESSEGEGVAIEAAPLDRLLSEEEIQRARFVKIDVEGWEWDVLQGMENFFAACRPDAELLAEVTPSMSEDSGVSCEQLLRFMHDRGFHAYHVVNDYGVGVVARGGPYRPPERLREFTDLQMDIIFSRRDVECLTP